MLKGENFMLKQKNILCILKTALSITILVCILALTACGKNEPLLSSDTDVSESSSQSTDTASTNTTESDESTPSITSTESTASTVSTNSEEVSSDMTSNQNQPDPALKNALAGKNISILGDSISTFKGLEGIQDPYYSSAHATVNTPDKTWWGQIIAKYGLNLAMNNSIGGSGVFSDFNKDYTNMNKARSGFIRASYLHSDTKKPDIVAINIGCNDHADAMPSGLGSLADTKSRLSSLVVESSGRYLYYTPKTFADAYYIMLHKIVNNYQNPDLFLFNIFSPGKENFNAIIKDMATEFKATLVDVYNTELRNWKTGNSLTDGTDNVHPNINGMNVMAQKFEEVLKSVYVK